MVPPVYLSFHYTTFYCTLYISREQKRMFRKPLPIISITQWNKELLFYTRYSWPAFFRNWNTVGVHFFWTWHKMGHWLGLMFEAPSSGYSGIVMWQTHNSEKSSSIKSVLNYCCAVQKLFVIKSSHAVNLDSFYDPISLEQTFGLLINLWVIDFYSV